MFNFGPSLTSMFFINIPTDYFLLNIIPISKPEKNNILLILSVRYKVKDSYSIYRNDPQLWVTQKPKPNQTLCHSYIPKLHT